MHKYDKDLRGETARLRNIKTHNATVVPTLGTVKKKRQIRIIRHTKKAEARTLDFV